MIYAYIMLNVEAGSEENVLKQLRALDIVEEAYVSYGVYDLIIKVKAETPQDMTDTVSRKVRGIDQVESTLTLVVTGEQ
jgi:DNA-binding Lrp family transcriptional regulator